jgi:hypothetical protein
MDLALQHGFHEPEWRWQLAEVLRSVTYSSHEYTSITQALQEPPLSCRNHQPPVCDYITGFASATGM